MNEFLVVRIVTAVMKLGIQFAGLCALYVSLGVWLTVALYSVGALAVILQQLVVRRVTSCSPGH